MEISDEGRVDQITDKFKDLTVTTEEQKVSDTPLTIPQAVRPPSDILRTEMALTELLGQKKALALDTISTSSPGLFLIRDIVFSYDYISEHLGDAMSTASRFFSGWRCECLEVTVEMTSMYQQQGAAVAIITNMPSPLYNAIGRGNVMAHLMRYPRKFMPFGNNATYTFQLGWNSLLKFWPLQVKNAEGGRRTASGHNSYMDNGRIVFRVFDSLKVATGVTDFVQLRFWVQLKGLRLGIYSPVNGAL
ncbi:MAG: capsid protein [Fushun polycipivirus 2]|nr:MAG: capsid protein [Fushun polycipivirus 2]